MRIFSDFRMFERPPKSSPALCRWIAGAGFSLASRSCYLYLSSPPCILLGVSRSTTPTKIEICRMLGSGNLPCSFCLVAAFLSFSGFAVCFSFQRNNVRFPATAADRLCIRPHCQPPFAASPEKMNEGAVSWSASRPCNVSLWGDRGAMRRWAARAHLRS